MSIRKLVTVPFRMQLLESHPELAKDPAYLRFAAYLLFPSLPDKTTGHAVISAEILASIEGKDAQLKSRHYRAVRFLERVKREALPNLQYSAWHYTKKQCRIVLQDGHCPQVKSASMQMLEEFKDKSLCDLVYLDTGTKFSRKVRADQRKSLQLQVARMNHKGSKDIID